MLLGIKTSQTKTNLSRRKEGGEDNAPSLTLGSVVVPNHFKSVNEEIKVINKPNLPAVSNPFIELWELRTKEKGKDVDRPYSLLP